MAKITLEIEFDDTDGYKGHGDDTADLIKQAIENEMSVSLEADGVIKKGWTVTLKKDVKTEITDTDLVVSEPGEEHQTSVFDRGDKVNFKGNSEYKAVQGTYIWAVGTHMMILYYIQHPDGNVTKESIAHNGGLPDGFETPHSRNFKTGLKYICVTGNELEKA